MRDAPDGAGPGDAARSRSEPAAERTPASGPLNGPGYDEQRCDLCGAPLLEWHCRLICTSCGFQRDCSDP
jgi:hypothetical protein